MSHFDYCIAIKSDFIRNINLENISLFLSRKKIRKLIENHSFENLKFSKKFFRSAELERLSATAKRTRGTDKCTDRRVQVYVCICMYMDIGIYMCATYGRLCTSSTSFRARERARAQSVNV